MVFRIQLTKGIAMGASDVHLKANAEPFFRVAGTLAEGGFEPLIVVEQFGGERIKGTDGLRGRRITGLSVGHRQRQRDDDGAGERRGEEGIRPRRRRRSGERSV